MMNEENLAELIFSRTNDVLTWYRLDRVSKRFNRIGLRERKFIRQERYNIDGNKIIWTEVDDVYHGPRRMFGQRNMWDTMEELIESINYVGGLKHCWRIHKLG